MSTGGRMEFADLDEDLFGEERHHCSIVETYSARVCDPGWFMEIQADELVSSEDKLSAQKYSADYLFLKKEYNAAVKKYEEVLNILLPYHTVCRRECLEGLVRCHIKKGTPYEALHFAEELHSTSKNSDQTTVSCSVLVDVNLAVRNYNEALRAAQMLVTIHPLNCHVWIKLAYVYACMYDIILSSVEKLVIAHIPSETVKIDQETVSLSVSQILPTDDTEVSDAQTFMSLNNTVNQSQKQGNENFANMTKSKSAKLSWKEKGLQFVATCLLKCYYILKKTEGTALNLHLEHNLMYQKLLVSDMKTLLDEESLNQIRMHVCEETQSGQSSPVLDDGKEFVDRGSSKFKSHDNEFDDVSPTQSNFEEKWFRWIK
ncbi:zinc fingers and homeoboxes protein 1-like isoform X2 [Cherax quadricarinatus]|uniref:zinc fingers and homeoboxes protein 1-like isoform X2 n=1 Tax=Cherax quadricarinatus TaxID=27406 RepID=UPI00387ECD08